MVKRLERIRRDFPAFVAKPDWVYLDTAATSQMPQSVMDALSAYHCAYRAPVHRGLYREAVRATDLYEGARASVAQFIGAAHPDEVVFTAGATHASNLLTYALERSLRLREGDEIVTTVMEHHSSLVPLQQLAARRGLTLTVVPMLPDRTLDYLAAERAITKRTKIVSVMLASNVLGTINDVARIAARAHKFGARVVSDMTAAVGHLPVDVRALGVDFAYFSGHKMCGPTGIGVLYGARKQLAELEPSCFGGGMVEHVTTQYATWVHGSGRFEAGTPNVAGAIGLGAAAEYLRARDLSYVRTYLEALVVRALDALGKERGITLYAAPPDRNVGIVSFTLKGVHAHDVAEVAARKGVALRAGHHCALPLHAALGVPATVRASFYLYNVLPDIDRLVERIERTRRVFGVS